MRPVLIVVPLYRNAELVEGLVQSLAGVSRELARLSARILFINDSPRDAALATALKRELPQLAKTVSYDLITNDRNLGFVGACNRGMAMALETEQDVLLLNSDALLTPGALSEIAQVATLDPMTGFVSPRSNNATICNSPYPDRFRDLDYAGALAAHRILEPHLPRQTYVPTAVGFCLYIRHAMLAEFGLFDPVYGGGYNEETDLILRANRRGYRAVMANHAFVYHIGGQSFSLTDTPPLERERTNRQILLSRYPAYPRAVERYFAGAECRSQTLLAGLVPGADGRRRLLFDCSYLGDSYNGTYEMNTRTLRAFAARHRHTYDIHVLCPGKAFEFHGLDTVGGLELIDGVETREGPFFACLRLSQPFSSADLQRIPALAPISGVVMHDTIALDCQPLDDGDLTELWQAMTGQVSILAYVSEFSKAQFNRRFAVPEGVVQVPALLSTDVEEYLPAQAATGTGDAILVIGNHFDHKFAKEMVAEIHARAPDRRVLMLGMELPPQPNLRSFKSGELDESQIEQLYGEACVVVFPTHYEGFGLPLMQALARKKPVIARPLPCFLEIAARTPWAANIHFAGATAGLAAQALAAPSWNDKAKTPASPVRRWGDVADDLAAAIDRAHERLDFCDLRRRMTFGTGVETSAGPSTVSPPLLRAADSLGKAVERLAHRLSWRLSGAGASALTAEGDRARDAGDYAFAAVAYRGALARDPSMDHIWVQYGHALKETGRWAAASRAYERAAQIAPDTADTHLQLGHVLKLLKRPVQARRHFVRALELDPDLKSATSEIGGLDQIEQGHMRRAILLARKGGGDVLAGCIIAAGPTVIGAGAGRLAVKAALSEARGKTAGASAFVTLAPNDADSRAMIAARLERVVISHGKGCERLADAGLILQFGLLSQEAELSLNYPGLDSDENHATSDR